MSRTAHQEIEQESPPSIVSEGEDAELVDGGPPPDHEGWLEACERGWRRIRERHEKRRRVPVE